MILGDLTREQRAVHRRCPCGHVGRPPPLDGVTRIDLVGLDDTGVVALMEAGAGHYSTMPPWGWPTPSTERPDGNPFFVSEVAIRNLVETGAIGQDAGGRWVGRGQLDAHFPCPTRCAK